MKWTTPGRWRTFKWNNLAMLRCYLSSLYKNPVTWVYSVFSPIGRECTKKSANCRDIVEAAHFNVHSVKEEDTFKTILFCFYAGEPIITTFLSYLEPSYNFSWNENQNQVRAIDDNSRAEVLWSYVFSDVIYVSTVETESQLLAEEVHRCLPSFRDSADVFADPMDENEPPSRPSDFLWKKLGAAHTNTVPMSTELATTSITIRAESSLRLQKQVLSRFV